MLRRDSQIQPARIGWDRRRGMSASTGTKMAAEISAAFRLKSVSSMCANIRAGGGIETPIGRPPAWREGGRRRLGFFAMAQADPHSNRPRLSQGEVIGFTSPQK
ncbi:MAG: hypothetical protein JWO83_2689 [Caulobacteraceae bacterium]|nr:hypothetical protein [Caulobacteraceae bacterium]